MSVYLFCLLIHLIDDIHAMHSFSISQSNVQQIDLIEKL